MKGRGLQLLRNKILRSMTTYTPPAQAVLLPTTSASPLDELTKSSLSQASSILQAGGLVAFPTETVYGLGASALSSTAALSIFEAKGRPSDNPLIVHIATLDMLYDLIPGGKAGVPLLYEPLIKKFWPGPLSLIFPLDSSTSTPPTRLVSKVVTAGQPSVAIRMPSHPLALALIVESNLPLAAPSANLSSRPSPTTAEHVQSDLGEGRGLGAILDGGPCLVGVESTVVDFVSSKKDGGQDELRVLRAGGVSAEDLESCLKDAGFGAKSEEKVNGQRIKVYQRDFREEEMEKKPTTPGMKYKHYAPTNSRVVLVRHVLASTANKSNLPPSLVDLLHASVLSSASDQPRVGLMLTTETLSSLHPTSLTPFPTSSSTLSHLLTFPKPEFSPISPTIISYSLGSSAIPSEAAQRLFAGLRYFDSLPSEEDGADELGVDVIMVECVEETGVGLAVMERARKAAGGMQELEFS